jgi:hypothetical protein
MATKKTTKPRASNLTKQIATRMDVVSFARLLAQTLGNDRWFTEEVISNTFKQSGPSAGTVKKESAKATKIPLIKSEDDVLKSLTNIHDLLKNSYEDRLKSSEKQNQFKEEQDLEKKKQNEELLKAIKDLKSGKEKKEEQKPTAQKEESDTNILGDLLDILTDMKDLFKAMKAAGPWLTTVLTGPTALAGAISALILTPFALSSIEKAEIDKDPYNKKYDDNAYALSVRSKKEGGNTTEGQAAAQLAQKSLKQIPRNQVEDFVKSDLTDAELQKELGNNREGLKNWLSQNPKKGAMYQVPMAGLQTAASTSVPAPAAAAPTTDTQSSPAPVPPMASPAPSSASSVSQKFNAINSENLDMKLPQEPSQKGTTVTNIQRNQQRGESSSLALPAVRNSEPTFQRMILDSTRVV